MAILQTRRGFVRNACLAAAAAAVRPAQAAPSPLELAGLDTDRTTADRIRRIEDFVHRRYYDPSGLLYSHGSWAEERPWVPSDFSPRDSTVSGPEPSQWLNYENSAMNAGMFLASQCYRYRATRDPAALLLAAQAFHALETDYRLTERGPEGGFAQRAGIIMMSDQRSGGGKGWFCKPYGGQPTYQTSTEQNFHPVWGMYLYHPIAPAPVQARIAQILREVSAHWRRNYRINFFGEDWNFETSYPRAPRHMISWAAIQRMCHEITRDPAAYDEYNRIDGLFGFMPTALETVRGLGEPVYVSTEDRAFSLQVIIAAEVLSELEPSRAPRYRRGALKWWRFAQIGQREDLLSYYFIKVDTTTAKWEPLPVSVKPRAIWTNSDMWENGTWPVCSLGVRERQALTSGMIARLAPEQAAAARTRWGQVYGKLGKDELHWMVDPEHVLPAPLGWMTRVLEGDALSLYPLGYWYAKAHRLGFEA